MKKFLNKILLYGFIIIIASLPIDWLISHFLKQSNQYYSEFEVMNDIYKGSAKGDIAIYGSSRAWVHINPKILEDSLNLCVYNFGIDGYDFTIQYLRHLEYLKHNPKPNTIILSMDIISLQKREDLYNLTQFLPYMLWNKNIKEFTTSYVGFKKSDYIFPLIRYYGKSSVFETCLSVILKRDGKKKGRYKGYLGNDEMWNDDFENAIQIMENYTVNLDTATVVLFEQFISECKKSNTELILVYTPEYTEGQEFISNRESIMNMYSNLAEKNKLLFLDYSKNSICNSKELFYNSMHLNAEGSNIFTALLANDLKNIVVR